MPLQLATYADAVPPTAVVTPFTTVNAPPRYSTPLNTASAFTAPLVPCRPVPASDHAEPLHRHSPNPPPA